MSNKNLNIILLCAGKSSRLKFNLPKVILPINGRTLIERSLENLDKLNPKKIIIVTGFRDDLVTNLVKTFHYKNIGLDPHNFLRFHRMNQWNHYPRTKFPNPYRFG